MEDTVIICVDDDPSVRASLLRDFSGKIRGCSIICAESGTEAQALYQSLGPQNKGLALILTAHVLPDMNGHDLIRSIQDQRPELLAILLTDARPPPATNHFASIYRSIPKPWRLEDLLFTVGGALETFHRRRQLAAQTEALKDSDQRLRAVIERAADGILTINQHGTIQSANPAVERIFGHPLHQLVGSNINILMPSQIRHSHGGFIDGYLKGGTAHAVDSTREVIGLHLDGSEIPLEVSVSEFSVGETRLFSGILRDISERRRVEQLAREKALAERQAAAKSEFLATMSHEIRTPMNGVLGMLELLEATGLSGEQANLLGICRDSAQYLLTIIDDILDFSKIDAGKLQFDLTECKLDDLVFSVSELLCSRAWAKDLELVSFVDNSLPASVVCDPARIRQILINLVGNAIKFTHHGQVSVRARPVNSVGAPGISSLIRFEVMDTGIGLNNEQINRLFRPFEQAEAGTTRRFGGTGLGLAISRRLVEMMDGQIGVTSTPGVGSTFWFEIPLQAASEPPPRPRLTPVVRILLVAANPIFRDAVERGLSAAGARVETVERFTEAGPIAQAAIGSDPFSLVVVEDGCAASHGAFSGDAPLHDSRLKGLPILLLARRDRGPIGNLLEITGADFGLSRPARPGLLLTTVKVALGQESADALERVQISGFGSHDPLDSGSLPFSGGRILVAEDTPTSRLVVTKMLQRMGLNPILAEDGLQAWQALQRQHFDLLLSDCHMPEMDGFDLCEKIRIAERDGQTFNDHRTLPIVALSAGVLDEEKARCMDVGMDGFLAKPIESKKLRQALLHWLPQVYHPSSSAANTPQRVAVSTLQTSALNTAARSSPVTPGASPVREAPLSAAQQAMIDQVLAENSQAADPSTTGENSVLDLAIYLELFGAITDDVHALLGDFLDGANGLEKEILTLYHSSDPQALSRAVHRLAGAALTAGAMDLGTLCRTLEQALKKDAPRTEIDQYVSAIPLAMDSVRAAIAEVTLR